MINRDTFTFIKEETGEWYIDLQEYIDSGGSKNDLQMVAGADIFLDFISSTIDKNEITIKFTDKEFKDAEKLHRIRLGDLDGFECGTGAWYEIKKYEVTMNMWLCDVTKYIFGEFPCTIYFKVV